MQEVTSPRSAEHPPPARRARPTLGRAVSVAEALLRHEQAAEDVLYEAQLRALEAETSVEGGFQMGAQVAPLEAESGHLQVAVDMPPMGNGDGATFPVHEVTRPASASKGSDGDVPVSFSGRDRGHSQSPSRNLKRVGQSSRSLTKTSMLNRRSTAASGGTEGRGPLRLGIALGERLLFRTPRKDPSATEDETQSEDDGESEAIDTDLEDPASRWSAMGCLWSFVFVIGSALLTAGFVVEFVPDKADHEAARLLFVTGGGLLLWPLSAQMVRAMLRVSQALYKRSRRSLAPGMSSGTGSGKAYYYMLEASEPLRLLIWALLTEVLVLVLLPRSDIYAIVFFHAVRVFASLICIFIASTVVTLICVRLSQNFNMQAYLARMAETLRHESIIYGLCAVRPHSLFSVLYDEVFNENENGEGGQLDPDVWGRAMRYINTRRADGTELPDGAVHTQMRGGVKAANARLVAETSRLAKFIFDKLFVLCDTARRLERNHAQQGIHRTLSSGALVEVPSEVSEPDTGVTAGDGDGSSRSGGSGGMLLMSRNSTDMGLTSGSDPRRRASGNLWGLFKPNSNHQTPRELAQLQHEDSSRTLAKVPSRVRDRRRIYKAQFVQVVGKFHPELEEHANEIWDKHFDPTGTGYSNIKRVARFLQVMFKARKNMSLTLQDSQTVFQGVRRFIFALSMIVVFMIILSLYNINVSEVWVALTGALLAWSFVFGETMRGLFECMIFLLDLHPYDVGDQIEFGGLRYEVRRINLRSTELLLPEGSLVCMENRHIYASNSIINYSRSENRCFWMSVEIDMTDVTEELMQQLRADFGAFLRKNADSFDPREYCVHARSMATMLKCELKFVWVHAYPFISLGRAFNDQDLVIVNICRTLTKNGVHFSGSGLGRIPFNLPETAAAAAATVASSHDANAALPTADPAPQTSAGASAAPTNPSFRPQTASSELSYVSTADSGLRRRERGASAGDSDSSRVSPDTVTPETPKYRNNY